MSSTRLASPRTTHRATHRTVRAAAAGLATASLVGAVTVASAGSASAATGNTLAATRATSCGAGCTVVSRADIDGDRRADTTSLTRGKGGKAYTLRTVTAAGRKASTTVKTPWLYADSPFHGAVAMDGARGSEIVLNTGSGAHTQYYAVYSWRSGKLVAQKDPTGSTEWVTDGAASFAAGYSLRTVDGVKQLTNVVLSRDSWEAPKTFSGTRTVARWQNGRWTPITVRKVTTPESPAVWSGAGWNVAGLQRW